MTGRTLCSSRSLHVRSDPQWGWSHNHTAKGVSGLKTKGLQRRGKKAPVCLCLTFPSGLKSPHAHLLSSTHTHCRAAAWKQLRGAASEGQDSASGKMQVILWADRWTAPVNGSFLIRFWKKKITWIDVNEMVQNSGWDGKNGMWYL